MDIPRKCTESFERDKKQNLPLKPLVFPAAFPATLDCTGFSRRTRTDVRLGSRQSGSDEHPKNKHGDFQILIKASSVFFIVVSFFQF